MNPLASPPVKLLADLQAKIRACIDPFVTGEPIAIVDFPNIRNVGDSALWLGEIAYFASRGISRPAYVSTMHDFSAEELDARMANGPIFIQAGGTFGDIWPGHQEFREYILQRWPGRPVIQLPQSIHFESEQRAAQSARIIAKHGNFTLMVRDTQSQRFAEQHFDCRIVLCPDMALYNGPQLAPPPQVPVLAMLRGDREKAADYDLSMLQDIPVEDWISEPWLPVRAAKLVGVAGALPSFDPMRMRLARFNAAARQRFNRGIRQLSRARTIITDRLHVHIVSMLLGRPHAILDNSYGKISRFMTAFGIESELVYRASSLSDAVAWARARNQLLERTG
jgi:exopolysaccharide biosynthesis predicted pyruvyltransferase EpsI